MFNKKWRNYFLIATAISTNFTAVFALIIPQAGHRSVADFKFPQYIELDSAKAMATKDFVDLTQFNQASSTAAEVQPEIVEAHQKYQYKQGKSPVSLEITYLSNTRGDVLSYLQKYAKIAPQAIQNQATSRFPAIGHHTLFQDRDRAYLSSCISPRSLSSVDQKQFSKYRYQNDLTLEVAWQWLQGKSSIRDRRCLWVHLSTPLVTDSQTAFNTLESAWKEVYQWWLPNFPAL